MSLKGLASEAKTYFKPDKAFLAFLGGVILLIGMLFYVRGRVHQIQGGNPAADFTQQQTEAKNSIQQLFQLQTEVEALRSDLNHKRMAAAADNPSQALPPIIVPRSSVRFVGIVPGQGFAQLTANSEDVYIPMGSVFRARLLMPIKTSVQESFVMAETTHEFRMDSIRRIPRKSRLIGTARLNPMLKGVVVRFHTLVSPSGIEFPISLLALSPSLFPELEGIYFTNELETYSAVLAFGFMEGFANAAQSREPSMWGAIPRQTATNQVLSGVSSASFNVADEIINDVRRRSVEYVVVPASENIFVVFDKRFILKDQKSIPE